MIQVRPASQRGHMKNGWLDTFHTFSFADYYDPQHMGFRALRVINEDRVEAAQGFGAHSHRDMEILSYVLEGALTHKDSMGNSSTLRHGDVQRMTAGTGVKHSEFNESREEPVHFLQIWVLPERTGLTPSYEELHFSEEGRRGKLQLLASREGQEGSLKIHQDLRFYATDLSEGQRLEYAVEAKRHLWLQIVKGSLRVEGRTLSTGDGAALSEVSSVSLEALMPTEALLFDLS